MLCSIPTSRSSPSWLDRLHASKGFPVPSDLDLDHFLSSNSDPNPKPNPTPPDPDSVDPTRHYKKQQSLKGIGYEKEQRLFDLMSNVLSELFVMGDPGDAAAGRKSSRKQLNPRACVPSASASADGGISRPPPAAMSPSSADNSIAEAKRDRKKMRRMRPNAGQAADSDPSVCTGTIVTVIDTSSPGWKTEKHFRKGMVWGRDKKVSNVSRKKRKMGLVEKLIVEKEKLRPLAELKEREQNENVESQNEGCTRNINGDGAKESDYHIRIPRRPKFLRSPRLPVKNSSLYRLQMITKNHKAGLSGLIGTLKGKP